MTTFTTVGVQHHNPAWSPDGARLAYRALREEGRIGDIYVQALTGDTVGVHIGGTAFADNPPQWLADGTILSRSSPAPTDITAFNGDRPGAGVPILQAPWSEVGAHVSSDGKWLAYASNEAGRYQLVVRAWPGMDRKAVVADSVEEAASSWSPDSRTLYYVRFGGSGAGPSTEMLMAASLAGTDSLRTVSRRVAIETLGGRAAAMHPDKQRFLVFRTVAAQPTTGQSTRRSLIVVTGWFHGVAPDAGREAVMNAKGRRGAWR